MATILNSLEEIAGTSARSRAGALLESYGIRSTALEFNAAKAEA
jgi:hypothetical protein